MSLRLDPDQTQFFTYDSMSLSCDPEGTVTRNTSENTRGRCEDWGILDRAGCKMDVLVSWDSGSYWCESTEGQRSESVHITVRGETMIELMLASELAPPSHFLLYLLCLQMKVCSSSSLCSLWQRDSLSPCPVEVTPPRPIKRLDSIKTE